MNQKENLLNLVKLIWQKRKTIFFACLITMIGSGIISLLIPNYYRSEAIFYAANPSLGNPLSLDGTSKLTNHYGNNRDLDRLFTIAKSNELFNLVLEKFNLYDHYKIDPKKAKAATKLRKKFNSNLYILKTEYDAFSLSFEDENPEFAAKVATEIHLLIDKLTQGVIKSSQLSQINTLKESVSSQATKLEENLKNLLDVKKKYQIFNVTAQEEAMAELATKSIFETQHYQSKLGYFKQKKSPRDSIRKYEALLNTSIETDKLITQKLDKFNEGSSYVTSLNIEKSRTTGQLNLSRERLKQLTNTYNMPFKATHLVEKAVISDSKFGPKRTIYVIAATICMFIFSLLTLIILNSYKSTNWKEVFNDDK